MSFRRRLERLVVPYSFLLPSLVILFVFSLIPFLQGIYYSLTDYPLFGRPEFTGLSNFSKLLRDPLFLASLRNTGFYMLGTVPTRVVLGLGLAVLLNRAIKGRTIFRAIFYFPVIAPMITVSTLWAWLYNTHFGIINAVLVALGGSRIPWLTSTSWALPSIMLMSVWKVVGSVMVIFLAGLQGIPGDLYEAARVDGANSWTLFSRITLPLLRPTVLLTVVLATIDSSKVFEQVYVMTGGGPGYATMTLMQMVYSSAFQTYQMGYASAVSMVLFAIVLILTAVQFRFLGTEVEY